MSSFVKRHFVPAMMAAIMIFVILPFFDSIMRIVDRSQSAITWYGVTVKTPTVKPGEKLVAVYRLQTNKMCPADIRAFLVAPDGSVPVRFPPVFGGYTRPTDDPTEAVVSIQIPREADPGLSPLMTGDYVYRSIATRYCPDDVEDDNAIPEARFVLEVPPEK